nr:alpha/beta hydrolase [uncultured Psychroserpens sp.]
MKSLLFISFFSMMVLTSCNTEVKSTISNEKTNNDISFYTKDSILIKGQLIKTSLEASTILLFHQGGSNASAEYESIIPKLTKQGFNVLAIDQRVGGQIYGQFNKTIVDITTNDYGYCDAYPDLESALDFIISKGFTGKKIVWGSSYSASLAIQLAHKRANDIDAVLAFSPASGNQLKDCLPNPYFETLKVPMLLLRPKREAEFESVQEQLKLAQSFGHQTYVAEHGVHGSSMLVESRVSHDVSDNWNIVNAFITNYKN